jgi:GntR family transcriptional regulator
MAKAIEFRIDSRSGVAPYLQIVHQVRGALRLGLLRKDDQLPTVKEVVAQVAINPNTVLKAYRALEHEGLVSGRPGVGTFVTQSVSCVPATDYRIAARGLARWVAKARAAGLDDGDIRALLDSTLRAAHMEGVA